MVLTVKQLLFFNIHLGHSRKISNDSMNMYLYGYKSGLSIINVNYTLKHIKILFKYLNNILCKWGSLLLVSQNLKYTLFFEKNFHNFCKFFKINYISKGWLTGILTNLRVIKKEYMINKVYEKKTKDLVYYTDKIKSAKQLAKIKVKLKLEKEWKEKLKGCFDLWRSPNLVFLFTNINYSLNWPISECFKMKIPCSGLVDSNMNPFGIVYPILSNNDNLITLLFFIKLIKKIIIISFLERIFNLKKKKIKNFFLKLKTIKSFNKYLYKKILVNVLLKLKKKYKKKKFLKKIKISNLKFKLSYNQRELQVLQKLL